jgi:hypothetical protein
MWCGQLPCVKLSRLQCCHCDWQLSSVDERDGGSSGRGTMLYAAAAATAVRYMPLLGRLHSYLHQTWCRGVLPLLLGRVHR